MSASSSSTLSGFSWWWGVVWTLVWTTLMTLTDGGQPGELQDYCERETFTAECSKHEVILIRQARYGRIQTSHCITDTYPIDCSTSARQYLDGQCSGRRKCHVAVVSLVPEARQPCDSNLRSYLEAIYDCLPVAHANPRYCNGGGGQLRLTAPIGYLSTLEANETGCGTVDTPWLIVAQSGQVISVTLLDFSGGANAWNSEGGTCQVIAVIRDVQVHDTTETVCGTGAREEEVFKSISHMIEVRLVPGIKVDNPRYPIIKYEMIGCTDVAAPSGGWMKRTNDVITMGCNHSDSMWTMKCDGTTWSTVGHRQNCTGTGTPSAAASGKGGGVWHVFSDSHRMSIVTILVIALVVGLIILLVGLVYLRRCYGRHPRQEAPRIHGSLPEEDYHIAVGKEAERDPKHPHHQPDQDSLKTYQSTGNNYYRTWQMQRHLSSPSGGGGGASLGSASLPPPPYSEQQMAGRRSASTSSQPQGNTMPSPYVEHIYESPKFDRRDAPYSSSNEGDTIPTEYYELDPESVVNVPDFTVRGK